jgi:hypothetical protein
MGTIAINDRAAVGSMSLGREPGMYEEQRVGNQPHPAGYYAPPAGAAAPTQQSPRPYPPPATQPALGQVPSATPIPILRMIDDPTSMPASSSQDKTHVYRPLSPAARMLATQPAPAPIKPARGVWTYLVVGLALLIVGFGLMSLVMYLR